jgi:hypothetical protein
MAGNASLYAAIAGGVDPDRQVAHGVAQATASPHQRPGDRRAYRRPSRCPSPVRRLIQPRFVVKTFVYPLLIPLHLPARIPSRCESRAGATRLAPLLRCPPHAAVGTGTPGGRGVKWTPLSRPFLEVFPVRY